VRAIQLLLAEHGMILDFLDLLQEAGKRIARDEGPVPEFFTQSVEFCRTYADKAHHYKEEHVMFGLLAQKHEGRLDDLIGTPLRATVVERPKEGGPSPRISRST